MKNVKKILILLLTLTLAFGLFACSGDGGKDPCTTCVDENGDGKCDVCKKDMPNDPPASLLLIEEGYPNFQFVIPSSGFASNVRDTLRNQIVRELNKKLEDDVLMVAEGSGDDTEMEIEVLVGNITTRGEEYKIDPHSLGKDGYVVKIVENKVVINAGSDKSLIVALEEFADNILGIGNSEITDVTMSSEDNITKIQDDYKVTSLAVNGTDMKGYTIAADLDRTYYWAVATNIQNTIYDRTGYWFEVVKLSEATEKSIVVKHIDKVYGEDSFKVYVSGSQLIAECAFDNMLGKATGEFLTQKIIGVTGDVNFTGDVFKKDISVVYYDDFGAIGDGVADDFKAIYDTHKFANECGQTVKADGSKTYRICDTRMGQSKATSVIIRTNVDWCGADFIIDDSTFTSDKDSPLYYGKYSHHVFEVEADEHLARLTITDKAILEQLVNAGINPKTTNIQIDVQGWDGPMMIIPYNSSHKTCRSPGTAGVSGSDMQEIILLDKDGNVSGDTPIIYDYTDITSLRVYRLDESTAITIENGTFTSKVCSFNTLQFDEDGNEIEPIGAQLARGITVTRSFTTLKNIKHYVDGELKLTEQVNPDGEIVRAGMGYGGFYCIDYCTDTLIENCIMTGRRNYRTTTNGSITGTTDLHMMRACNVVIDGCKQSNFWITVDPVTYEMTSSSEYTPGAVTSMSSVEVYGKSIKLCWGVMSSNYCKNMEYRNSTLSRFDAHAPIVNGKIVNCNINDIELTGYGEFVIENVNWYPYAKTTPLLFLRGDFGSTWDGNVKIKNTEAYIIEGNGCYIVENDYSNFYWGYQCGIPSLEIDNFDCYNRETGEALQNFSVNVLRSFTEADIDKHLSVTNYEPTRYSVIDADGDGYIDEPLIDINRDGRFDEKDKTDLDGDGKIGNTCLKYADYEGQANVKIPEQMLAINPNIKRYANANPVKPPEYIKIINNDGVDGSGGYGFIIPNTSGKGVSDGAWWDKNETYGGFFGDTRFIYGDGEGDLLVGTAGEDPSGTFIFE